MKSISIPNRPTHRQKGVTLVEVLVTVIIISVGLLGVAALHLTSLRNSYDSNIRSKAVWLANDIVERMRANREVARDGDYDVAFGGTLAGGTVAGNDVNAWQAAISDATHGLPTGQGSIDTNTVGDNVIFTIRVQWTERDGLGALEFMTQTEI